MMKRFIFLYLVIFMAGIVSYSTSKELYKLRGQQRESIETISLLNPEAIAASSLEFKGVTSDYIFLRVMTYIGERLLARTEPDKAELDHVYKLINQVIFLDPSFWDPYLLTETMLIMRGEFVEKGNLLLEKAAATRTTDYRPYFFLWYNTYFYNHDLEKAEYYLYEAAKRPNAPTYLSGVASRMSLSSGKLESSIIILTELMNQTSSQEYKEYLKTRITTLQMIGYLENAIQAFKSKYGVLPSNLEELVRTHLIKQIPADPYGGQFFITPRGRVYTTSKMVPVKPKANSSR